MSIGKVGPFDLAKDSWDIYIDRLEQYFIANSIKSEVKVATLITAIGNDAYELMVSLCTPDKPSTKTYTELIAVMKGHLNPKPSMLAERFKFRQRIQKPDENISNYVTELKKMTKNCSFSGDSLKEHLRDQFVCGLVNDDIRQRLFTEDDTITFEKAYKLAVSMEAAEVNAALVDDCTRGRTGDSMPTSNSTSVHRINSSKLSSRSGPSGAGSGGAGGGGYGQNSARAIPRDSTGGVRGGGPRDTNRAGSGKFRQFGRYDNKITSKSDCSVCGGKHDKETCKFKNYVCRVCNQDGHLKRMCPRLSKMYTLHNIESGQNTDMKLEDSDSDEVLNFSLVVNDNKFLAPYTINVIIEGICINMEIDTGSAISCISKDYYVKMFRNCKLIETNLVLRYYTGEKVKPLGKIIPAVRYENMYKKLDLYIVESGKTSLLGRNWIKELNIKLPITDCHVICDDNIFDLNNFSSSYCEVFSEGLGRFTGGTVGFRLREGARPMFLRARPLAYALREPVERALDQMVRDGIITPVTTSDWATPIVPVLKKDGTIRVCADFKLTLNKCLEVDHYPLPKVEDLLTKLHGGEKFTKLDLSQAYAQFELDESKKFTVINTHKGLFMYNRLIYGLSSSPGIFQRKLEQLFADMPRVGVFLDDLIITGSNNQSHVNTLHEVFSRLQKYGLKIKKEKCTFFADSVTYLGFVISKNGVHTCPDKVSAIKNAPVPTNVSELRSFLGLVMYYAKFVPNISTILSPLYVLLRKDTKFHWDDSCMHSFNKVKKMLVCSEVLAHYSPELTLILTTDASSVGIGAVISHLMPDGVERPIAYASRVLNAAEKSYSQIEREALAIIYGVRKFHQYLYGRKFVLKTDHKPLVTIFGDKTGIPVMAASRMQRWAVILAGYDYSIEYVRSEKNAADALSRLPAGDKKNVVCEEVTYLNFVQNFLPITRNMLRQEISKDETLKKVFLFTQSGWPNDCKDDDLKPYYVRRNELYIDRGCLVWGYRLVIPNTLRAQLLKELHLGHLGVVKMKSVARSFLWWPGVDGDIENACRRCETCAREGAAPPHAPPQPWPYRPQPWTRLHLDFLGPFQGKTFLVLIDSTTKWIEVFPMMKTTASAVIKLLRQTFARFGLPREVVSDNGPPFTSKEYLDFMTNNGIKVTFSPAYHPSSNGAAEGAVKLCKRAIRKSIRDNCDLDTALQTYLMSYRNVEHSTTGSSPALLLQQRRLRSRLDLLREDNEVEDRVQNSQQKQIMNSGGTHREFKVGDTVWVRDYAGGRWLGGRIEGQLGSRNYMVSRESGPPVKRHVDQIKMRLNSSDATSIESSVPSTSTIPSFNIPRIVSSTRVVAMDDPVATPGECARRRRSSVLEGSQVNSDVSELIPNRSLTDDNIAPPNMTSTQTDTELLIVNRPKRITKPVKRYGFD